MRMEKISQSVVKRDHATKTEGRSIYVGDYETATDGRAILVGKVVHSELAHARILAVDVPELPEGCFYVDARDIPGKNRVHMIIDDTPVFCDERAEYVGDAIGMIVAPDEEKAKELLAKIKVHYEELPPVLDPRESCESFGEHDFGYGDVAGAFAEADQIYEEEFETGYQEHAYMEPQAMMAEPSEDGGMFLHGSCQGIYSIMEAVPEVLGVSAKKIRILQDTTGGGFGGKQSFPSILACQVAVAARKAGAPVRCIYERQEDIEYSCKRHPAICRYRVAVKDGRVSAVDADILMNGGAYATLSVPVLERALSCSSGVYFFPNLHVRGRVVRTNTVPNDAFRGFGGPQVIFAVERMMDHVARDLAVEPLAFRELHIARQGDPTCTNGRFHFPVPLPEMIEDLDLSVRYRQKQREYDKPQTGRFRRGIGLSLCFHGDGFTGTEERDVVKGAAGLRKDADGRVEILASSGEIGQGVRTTFPKIVAETLHIPLEQVFFDLPDSSRVPDSGPTSGSRSIMIVGELLRRAALRLRDSWVDGEVQEVEEHYKEPDHTIPFDHKKYQGDAYQAYVWAVNVIEVEVDTFTGKVRILNASGDFDAGTPIDENIVIGQVEGGFLQGIGQVAMEKLEYDDKGRFRSRSFAEYLIPTAKDVPELKVLLHSQPYSCGPFGAKGVGELPQVGVAPAYVAAVEQALGGGKHHLNRSPFTAEEIIMELAKEVG